MNELDLLLKNQEPEIRNLVETLMGERKKFMEEEDGIKITIEILKSCIPLETKKFMLNIFLNFKQWANQNSGLRKILNNIDTFNTIINCNSKDKITSLIPIFRNFMALCEEILDIKKFPHSGIPFTENKNYNFIHPKNINYFSSNTNQNIFSPLIEKIFFILHHNYGTFITLREGKGALIYFLPILLEYANKLKIEIQDDDKYDISHILEKITTNKFINLNLSFDEQRELRQYSSILEKSIFISPFVLLAGKNYEYFQDRVRYYEEEKKQQPYIFVTENSYYQLETIEDLGIKPLNKIEIFSKKYYVITFNYIIDCCKNNGFLFEYYNLDDYCIDYINGLNLFQYENLENWGDKITHILRCDNCHNQLRPYTNDYIKSSLRKEEAKFECPTCKKIYTYSQLKKIYNHNIKKSYI